MTIEELTIWGTVAVAVFVVALVVWLGDEPRIRREHLDPR